MKNSERSWNFKILKEYEPCVIMSGCAHCKHYVFMSFFFVGVDWTGLSNLIKYQSKARVRSSCVLFVRYQSYCSSGELVLRLCFSVFTYRRC